MPLIRYTLIEVMNIYFIAVILVKFIKKKQLITRQKHKAYQKKLNFYKVNLAYVYRV